jgi:hypothetical protein
VSESDEGSGAVPPPQSPPELTCRIASPIRPSADCDAPFAFLRRDLNDLSIDDFLGHDFLFVARRLLNFHNRVRGFKTFIHAGADNDDGLLRKAQVRQGCSKRFNSGASPRHLVIYSRCRLWDSYTPKRLALAERSTGPHTCAMQQYTCPSACTPRRKVCLLSHRTVPNEAGATRPSGGSI